MNAPLALERYVEWSQTALPPEGVLSSKAQNPQLSLRAGKSALAPVSQDLWAAVSGAFIVDNKTSVGQRNRASRRSIEVVSYAEIQAFPAPDIEKRLKDLSTLLKIYLSSISMHLTSDLRESLIQQIDCLFDPIDWEEGQKWPLVEGFRLALSVAALLKPVVRTNLGITLNGAYTLSWREDNKILYSEFLNDREIRWSFSKKRDDGTLSTAAGRSLPDELADWLVGMGVFAWFDFNGDR